MHFNNCEFYRFLEGILKKTGRLIARVILGVCRSRPVLALRNLKLVVFYVLRLNVLWTEKKQARALFKVKHKDRITVAFFLLESSNWKYDSVYRQMANDSKFDPIIVLCPFNNELFNHEQTMDRLLTAESFCKNNNYKYLSSWDRENKIWVDVKSAIKPDIVFFSNPHSVTLGQYCIENFLDTLTCYVPYSVRSDHLIDLAFNQPFEQLTWLNFYETEVHRKIAVKVALNKGRNVEVVGYPTFDSLIEKTRNHQNKTIKKTIVWAPHWTIEQNNILNRSCFLEFYDFFIKFGESYREKVNIIFRPHPFLKAQLSKDKYWGKERTNAYYKLWLDTPNLSFSDGDYVDVFAASDLLVHDSVSFLTEYLVTGKPSIFTQRQATIDPPFNEFGVICLGLHYVVDNQKSLEKMIIELLFANKDPKLGERQTFIDEFIKPNLNSAEKIVRIIKQRISK